MTYFKALLLVAWMIVDEVSNGFWYKANLIVNPNLMLHKMANLEVYCFNSDNEQIDEEGREDMAI